MDKSPSDGKQAVANTLWLLELMAAAHPAAPLGLHLHHLQGWFTSWQTRAMPGYQTPFASRRLGLVRGHYIYDSSDCEMASIKFIRPPKILTGKNPSSWNKPT